MNESRTRVVGWGPFRLPGERKRQREAHRQATVDLLRAAGRYDEAQALLDDKQVIDSKRRDRMTAVSAAAHPTRDDAGTDTTDTEGGR